MSYQEIITSIKTSVKGILPHTNLQSTILNSSETAALTRKKEKLMPGNTRQPADMSDVERQAGWVKYMQEHRTFLEPHEREILTPLATLMDQLGVSFDEDTRVSKEKILDMQNLVGSLCKRAGERILDPSTPQSLGIEPKGKGRDPSNYREVFVSGRQEDMKAIYDLWERRLSMYYRSYDDLGRVAAIKIAQIWHTDQWYFQIINACVDENGKEHSLIPLHVVGPFIKKVSPTTIDEIDNVSSIFERLLHVSRVQS